MSGLSAWTGARDVWSKGSRSYGSTEEKGFQLVSRYRFAPQLLGPKSSVSPYAPINMNYALHQALRLVLQEGLEARFTRHQLHHTALKAGLEAMGIRYSVAAETSLPMLNAVLIPEGADDASVRSQLLNEFGIEIGGGLGPMKGKTWRIGLMGEAAKKSNVLLFLAALEQCLNRQGIRPAPGAAIVAANAVYCSV